MKLADAIWHRVVQCVQEGILTGTDVSDSLRQITVCPSSDDPNVLVLTAEYEEQVKAMHAKLLADAQGLADKRGPEVKILDWNTGNKDSN